MTLAVGDKRGQWTILKPLPVAQRPDGKSGNQYVRARCSCGVEKNVRASNVENGRSRSCGHDLAQQHSKVMSYLLEIDKRAAKKSNPQQKQQRVQHGYEKQVCGSGFGG